MLQRVIPGGSHAALDDVLRIAGNGAIGASRETRPVSRLKSLFEDHLAHPGSRVAQKEQSCQSDERDPHAGAFRRIMLTGAGGHYCTRRFPGGEGEIGGGVPLIGPI